MSGINRFFSAPKGSFFLFGPRGTGKTTWLKKTFPSAAFIDLLEPSTRRHYMARPERLLDFVAAQTTDVVIIDEVQEVPELLSVVHKLLEERKATRFVLTGSSARKLKRKGVDLLAGRAIEKRMHPFMAAELGEFDIAEALTLGMIPLVRDAPDPAATLGSYIDLYLREEVQAERLVRNVSDFARFLEAITFSHGSVLNIAEVSRECEVKRDTCTSYVEILEDLLIGSRLPVFERRAKRAVVSHPKFYYFDVGVFRSLRPTGPLDPPQSIGGPALEGLVYQHLRAWTEYSGLNAKLYFWRTRSGSEVDFVLYGKDTFYAIEVTSSARIGSRDTRSLRTFFEDYPECTPLLLHGGALRFKRGGVLCIPVAEFLRDMVPEQPLM